MGAESIWRTMKPFDDLVSQTLNANHKAIYEGAEEGEEKGETAQGDDDMGSSQLVGGDYNVHYHNQKPGESKLLKAVGIAALVVGSGGLGLAMPSIIDAFSNDTPIVESLEEPTIGIIELGEPDGENGNP